MTRHISCMCGFHSWSPINRGKVYRNGMDTDFPRQGTRYEWFQVGTQACKRPGCEATRQMAREGVYCEGVQFTIDVPWREIFWGCVEFKYPEFEMPYAQRFLALE